MFVNNANSTTVNFITNDMTQSEIIYSVSSTLINIIFLILLLLVEYKLFLFMLLKSSSKYTNININIKDMTMKYFVIGVFSNFFYFLSTVGLEYLHPLINGKQFENNQKFRILVSCLFICLLLLLESLFDKWIFDWTYILFYICIDRVDECCMFMVH